MIPHHGMRPQDIAVLFKIILSGPYWMNKDLAQSLYLSPAEISYSLQRSVAAELLDSSKKKVMRKTLLEFLQYGLPRVFPAIKGAIAIGIPTAYSASVMASQLMSNTKTDVIVWPHPDGVARGESISPLYPNAVFAALSDPLLYNLLALADVMRLGKVREKEIAIKILKEQFNNYHV